MCSKRWSNWGGEGSCPYQNKNNTLVFPPILNLKAFSKFPLLFVHAVGSSTAIPKYQLTQPKIVFAIKIQWLPSPITDTARWGCEMLPLALVEEQTTDVILLVKDQWGSPSLVSSSTGYSFLILDTFKIMNQSISVNFVKQRTEGSFHCWWACFSCHWVTLSLFLYDVSSLWGLF